MDNPAFTLEVNGERVAHKVDSKPTQHVIVHTIDEAITLTEVGKFHYFLLLIGGMCFMSVMCEIMGVGLILPSLKCDLQATLSEQSMLTSAGFFGICLSSHAMGFLADTWGRVRTLRCALFLSAISTIISAFSVNIWMLIAFRFLTGFFISGGQACVFSMCGEFHGNKTRVRHVTLLASFMPLACILLPTVAMFVLPLHIDIFILGIKFSSWRFLLITNSLITMLALVGLALLPETPKYVLVQGDHDGALKILRRIYAANTGRSADSYPVEHVALESTGASITNIHGFKDAMKMVWNQTAPLFYRERCLHTINICIALFIIFGISQGLFMWLPTILNEMVRRQDENLKVCYIINSMQFSSAATHDACAGELNIFMFQVLAIIGAIFTLLYLFFAYTIDYIGKKRLLICWLLVAGSSATIIHWITNFSLTIVVLTLIMAIGNCGGIISTISVEFFPTNINSMALCFIMMIGRLGAFAGSNIIGLFLFDYCNRVFFVILAITFVLCGMCYCLPKGRTERSKPAKLAI